MNPLAVVTGGTKGIGRALVERFVRGGFDVVTCARNEQDLAVLQQEVSQLAGGRILCQQADLSVRSDLDNFITFVHSLERPVDVLVNNTGVFMPGQIHNEEEGVLEKTIETNVYSAYHLTRGLIPTMMERRKGHVFNMCSTASITAYPNGGSYCISKFALHGMTKVLREEMKPFGVKVTAILPGATLTSSWEGTDLPEERFMKAEDVAETVWAVYHLSPGAVVEDILMRPQLGDIG
ncbi:SDR family oxidoreductase [Telluribacter sp. SYSU D00476]|uniref:SDR family oxidoreductase n=1 Tax=Telluribacter sp. SYSU D00476 TaxID=2811430 RepID=UPI001FF365EA|nr:SDR family oxidoreductase [Telluribacter sp. SYSU D00476]